MSWPTIKVDKLDSTRLDSLLFRGLFPSKLLQDIELRAPLPAPYQDVRSADSTVQEIRLRHEIIKILGSKPDTLEDIASTRQKLYELCTHDAHFADACILPESFHTIQCMTKQRSDMELLSSVSAVPCRYISLSCFWNFCFLISFWVIYVRDIVSSPSLICTSLLST